jgi:hypothetical protein
VSWITITLADLNDARVAELIDALRKEELGAGQGDPMPRRIQTVVDEIRRCIRFGNALLDADTAKIPAGLKDLAVEKIVRGLKGRLLLPLTDDEKEAEKLYQRRLEQLTKGEWPVDTTDNPEATPTVSKSAASQVIKSGAALCRGDLAGL